MSPLRDWIISKLQEFEIHSFYYFSLKENFDMICDHGILPKNKVNELGFDSTSFADEAVQNRRDRKSVTLSDKISYNVHDLVPVYLTPKTPTLYARKELQEKIFFAEVQSNILVDPVVNYAFTNGNIASDNRRDYYSLNFLKKIDWDTIRDERWSGHDDGRRKRCSEFLIHPSIPLNRIWRFVVNNDRLNDELKAKLNQKGIDTEVITKRDYFFE